MTKEKMEHHDVCKSHASFDISVLNNGFSLSKVGGQGDLNPKTYGNIIDAIADYVDDITVSYHDKVAALYQIVMCIEVHSVSDNRLFHDIIGVCYEHMSDLVAKTQDPYHKFLISCVYTSFTKDMNHSVQF